LSGVARGFQPLNEPTRKTSWASGLKYPNRTERISDASEALDVEVIFTGAATMSSGFDGDSPPPVVASAE
jgi:hypothetical protein